MSQHERAYWWFGFLWGFVAGLGAAVALFYWLSTMTRGFPV